MMQKIWIRSVMWIPRGFGQECSLYTGAARWQSAWQPHHEDCKVLSPPFPLGGEGTVVCYFAILGLGTHPHLKTFFRSVTMVVPFVKVLSTFVISSNRKVIRCQK